VQIWTEKSEATTAQGTGRSPSLLAAFLGAVTAAGMSLILFVAVLVVTYLVAHARHDDFPAVAQTVLSGGPAVDAVGAAALSGTFFGAFFCGGFVAARLSSRDGRREGFLVWSWALSVPFGLMLAAVVGGGTARRLVSATVSGVSTTAICASLLAVALLGALTGGDTGQRVRGHGMLPEPAVSEDPAPLWVDPAPVAAGSPSR